MKLSSKKILPILSIALIACNSPKPKVEEGLEKERIEAVKEKELTKEELILQDCIEAHGGKRYESAHYAFVFRGKTFTFHNNGSQYEYTMQGEVKGQIVNDSMVNNEFTRTVKGEVLNLNEKQKSSYSESLNSVIYFATLPHKLRDKAVNKTYQGKDSIKGMNYDVLKITFDQEGGGKDHDDQYFYWINSKTKKIDYLAYNYTVNKGGVRFRAAYNKRVVGGITFQDYINYKGDVGTLLADLPKLYETEVLEELSRIETEQVQNLTTE